MLIALHKNATTTPAIRLALQQARGTDRELAQQYGIGVDTVRKWRHRSAVQDASHTAHRLQTTLNAAQEELVIYLRTQLLLPLDDLLAMQQRHTQRPQRLARTPVSAVMARDCASPIAWVCSRC